MTNDSRTTIHLAVCKTESFYKQNPQIKESHGFQHVSAVLSHAQNAVDSQTPPLSPQHTTEVLLAALLHDVDDHKYFPSHMKFENAEKIMNDLEVIDADTRTAVIEMISWVSCSVNGNSVPRKIEQSGEYWRLIPRWSDRLEVSENRC